MAGKDNPAPFFTVFLPTNGRDDVIGTSLDSILNQSFRDFELIVMGDGCTDGTADIVARYAETDPRVRWLSYDKGTAQGYANRNMALAEARGTAIAFAQHDDLMFHDHLQLLAGVFQRDNVMWAYSRPAWIDDAGRIMPYFVNLYVATHRQFFLQSHNIVPTNCVAIRRSVLTSIGTFDETLPMAADWDLWKRIVNRFGPETIGFVRHITGLHFRAKWKEGDAWGPPPLPHLSAMAASSAFWPPQLKLDLSVDNEAPQLTVARMMAANPAHFANQIRFGSLQLQDALSWTLSFDPLTPRC
ncbi:glycosyltransferase family 2 protein [Phaeobacter marinintestinus]|uniref:glycosyltransferase family 2 protein n=1 Tax=Falsiphaeobacter marinintestinus TaxID=1492905 RepID=UPI001647A1FB|nr:glycosyltransferase [Phaeobacter marinintestinus]